MGILSKKTGSSARVPAVLLAAAVCAWCPPLAALETDQYYAWGRELADATDVLNAKVTAEISLALEQVHGRRQSERMSCHEVSKEIVSRFKQFIFHDIELWTKHTPLVERVPATEEEELEFRCKYLYHNDAPLDFGTTIPPSGTIKLNGVAVGTDKLSHFFSEGWWYYRSYRDGLEAGLSPERAEWRAIRRGVFYERTILGLAVSGVFSLGDLEANYEGMRFFDGLCQGGEPHLARSDAGWKLVGKFDFRDYVTPEWDESYQASVFSKRRWRRVLPVLTSYCPMLTDPGVARLRHEYVERDRLTPTERYLQGLVRAGKLPDPRRFSLEFNCPQGGSDRLALVQEWTPGRTPAGGELDARPANP